MTNTQNSSELLYLEEAARYRWLRKHVEAVRSRKVSEELHEYGMRWQIKEYLTAVTAVGDEVSFDEAIDLKTIN